MRSKIFTLVLAALAATASSFAQAETAVAVQSEVVRYDDLRLISAVGAAVLYGRIRIAAERTCGVPSDGRQLKQEAKFRACVDSSIAKAVAQVNEPILTQYHETKLARANQKPATTAPNGSSVAKTP